MLGLKIFVPVQTSCLCTTSATRVTQFTFSDKLRNWTDIEVYWMTNREWHGQHLQFLRCFFRKFSCSLKIICSTWTLAHCGWQGAHGTLWPFNPLVSPLRALLSHRHTLSAGSAVFIPTMLIQGRECLLPAGGHRDCLHPVAVMIQIKLKEIQT